MHSLPSPSLAQRRQIKGEGRPPPINLPLSISVLVGFGVDWDDGFGTNVLH